MTKVLVVEDNAQNRLLVKDLLEFHGFVIIEAENGEEGIRLARAEKPDLILMDIQMPVMDGFSAGKILKEDPETKGIKLLAVTSFAMKGDREKVMAAGFDGYISKPIDTRGLPGLIRKFLE